MEAQHPAPEFGRADFLARHLSQVFSLIFLEILTRIMPAGAHPAFEYGRNGEGGVSEEMPVAFKAGH